MPAVCGYVDLISSLQEGYVEAGYCPREPCARLPSTYINHYCANGGVVCPQFGGIAAEADKRALETLQMAYGPGYKVCVYLACSCAEWLSRIAYLGFVKLTTCTA